MLGGLSTAIFMVRDYEDTPGKELLWKVHFEAARIEHRAHFRAVAFKALGAPLHATPASTSELRR